MNPQDELARHREVEQGRRAQALLDTQYFRDVVERVRDAIYGDFAQSAFDDDNRRRYARIKLGMIDDLLKTIRKDVDTGKAATEQLRREQQRKEFT